MKWQTADTVAAPLETIERVLFDRAALERIPDFMTGIRSVNVVGLEVNGTRIHRALYCCPTLSMPWFARRVKPETTEWTEHLAWNTAVHCGEFRVEPNIPHAWRSHFECFGTYTLEQIEPSRCIRRIECQLGIRAGVMAGTLSELVVVGILKRQFRQEARWLAHSAINRSS